MIFIYSLKNRESQVNGKLQCTTVYPFLLIHGQRDECLRVFMYITDIILNEVSTASLT